MSATFVPGLQLAREFYAAEVRPLLENQFSGLRYAAALIGQGSEVAGFDTERSTDHDWGPRLQVFLSDSDAGRQAAAITETHGTDAIGNLDRCRAFTEGAHRLTTGRTRPRYHHVFANPRP